MAEAQGHETHTSIAVLLAAAAVLAAGIGAYAAAVGDDEGDVNIS